VIEFRNPDYPWPDRPRIPERIVSELDFPDPDDEEGIRTFWEDDEPDVEEENTLMLRRQCLFRWAAQAIAISMSKMPEVEKITAFGAVAQPLKMEIPRFRAFRRRRIEILHECADLDLAVWISDLGKIKDLRKAMTRGLQQVQNTPFGGVAHHQVDVHIFDARPGEYRGRQCAFRDCPKPGKRECRVPGCGAQPFLQQYRDYRFDPRRFEAAGQVVLFDRATRFLVRPPKIGQQATS